MDADYNKRWTAVWLLYSDMELTKRPTHLPKTGKSSNVREEWAREKERTENRLQCGKKSSEPVLEVHIDVHRTEIRTVCAGFSTEQRISNQSVCQREIEIINRK